MDENAHTLEQQFTFGSGFFQADADSMTHRATCMTVAGNALYIGRGHSYSLQVFSLAGEHLREVSGDFRVPLQVQHFKERLYLLDEEEHAEEAGGEDDDDSEGEDVEEGDTMKRITTISAGKHASKRSSKVYPQINACLSSRLLERRCRYGRPSLASPAPLAHFTNVGSGSTVEPWLPGCRVLPGRVAGLPGCCRVFAGLPGGCCRVPGSYKSAGGHRHAPARHCTWSLHGFYPILGN